MRRIGLLLLVVALVVFGSPTARGQEASDTARIVVVPDTQIYAQSDSGGATAQAQFDWIADNAAVSNTVFVTHVGDVVQEPESSTEWDRIEPGFAALEAAAVPYGIAPGNHDIDSPELTAVYDTRFSVNRFNAEPWFGGSHPPEGNRSSWQTVEVGDHDILMLHLRHLVDDYGDVDAVLDWAQSILDRHPNHLAIVTTHEFTEGDGSVRLPQVRDALAESCTVALVLSGHRLGESAEGTFTDACGRTVRHLLTNYQFIDEGGQGFLRTLDINVSTLQVESAIYSPTLDEFRSGDSESASFALTPLVPIVGDANCDRSLDLGDAVVIVQWAVGRIESTTESCVPFGADTMNLAGADADGSGDVNLADALLLAQCSVGLAVCE